jgi:hypothetical protein
MSVHYWGTIDRRETKDEGCFIMTSSDCINGEQDPACCLCDSIIVPEAIRRDGTSGLLNKAVVLRAADNNLLHSWSIPSSEEWELLLPSIVS